MFSFVQKESCMRESLLFHYVPRPPLLAFPLYCVFFSDILGVPRNQYVVPTGRCEFFYALVERGSVPFIPVLSKRVFLKEWRWAAIRTHVSL